MTAQQLLDHCSARLAAFKVPSGFEFLEALPHTSVGKIQKHRLDRSPRP